MIFSCLKLSSADQKIQIAVMDFVPKDTSFSLASTVSNSLRMELFNTGKYSILEKSNIDKILKDQSFQMTDCISADCTVKIAKIGAILTVQQVVIGNLSKIEYKYNMTAKVIDVKSAKVITNVSEECISETQLPDLCKYVAGLLAGLPVEKKLKEPVKREAKVTENIVLRAETSYDISWRSALLPGWGQIENGQDLKGYAIAGCEIMAIGSTIYFYLLHDQAVKDYQAAGADSDFQSLVKKEGDTRSLNNICFWVSAAIWVYGVIDPFIFDPAKSKGVQKPRVISFEYQNDGIKIAYLINF
ncbi:MAG: hypothetical protein ABH873_09015 [Candidatus Firestonebacteria bacterium]